MTVHISIRLQVIFIHHLVFGLGNLHVYLFIPSQRHGLAYHGLAHCTCSNCSCTSTYDWWVLIVYIIFIRKCMFLLLQAYLEFFKYFLLFHFKTLCIILTSCYIFCTEACRNWLFIELKQRSIEDCRNCCILRIRILWNMCDCRISEDWLYYIHIIKVVWDNYNDTDCSYTLQIWSIKLSLHSPFLSPLRCCMHSCS